MSALGAPHASQPAKEGVWLSVYKRGSEADSLNSFSSATLSASLDSEEAAAVETSDQHAEDISLRKPAVFAAFSLPCLLRYPADYILLCSVLCVFVCSPRDTLHLKEREALLQMPRSPCGSCRAPFSDSDRHVICALCLGLDHAALALTSGGCELSEEMPMSTLRARLALLYPPPASGPGCSS
ncbi:hypothetical protein PO909_006027 [Leuciscus waleckii]